MYLYRSSTDIYGRGSIAIRNESMTKPKFEERSNEEIRIVAFGPISEYLNDAKLPDKLPYKSQKIARIGLGENHAVFLFLNSEIAVSGKNDKGQLGIPIKEEEEENLYKGLTLVQYPVFKDNDLRVIDVAAGSNHTMFLTEPINPKPDEEYEQRQVYVCGDRNMLG